MKLQNQVQLDIPVSEMKDGEIGVITGWYAGTEKYIGIIVQRYNEKLVALQKPYIESWISISESENCRVRILQKGETLIIE